MPSWGDVISFVLTFSLFAGVIVGGMFISRSLNQTVASTKQSLKEKGLNLTSDGTLHIKTSGRYSHEAYLDATQKAFIDGAKRMQAAGSFGHADDIYRVASPPPSVPGSPSLSNNSPGPSRSSTMPTPAKRTSSSYSRSESMGSGAMSPPRRKESGGTTAAPSAFRAPSVGFAPGPPKRSASAGSIDDMGRYGSPEPEDGSGKKKKGIFGALKRRTSDKKKGSVS